MSRKDMAAHAVSAADIAAMFSGELLAIAPHWEDRFARGTLPTLLDKRAAERGQRAGFFDDDDQPSSSSSMGPYKRYGGVAVVDICGPLMQHGGWLFDGHESIRDRAEAAAQDERVSVGALRVDSPGGVVAGCFDAVRAVRDAFAKAGKPLLAWCGGDGGFSAGYAWACAASEVSVPETGGVGSIGVISKMVDFTKMNADMGVRVDVIRSGARKAEGDPDTPNTDGAIQRRQSVVNDTARVFATVVSEARDLSADSALALEAESFYGPRAVETKLADRVETFDQFIARCVALAEKQEGNSMSARDIKGRLGLAEDAADKRMVEEFDRMTSEHAARVKDAGDKLAAEKAAHASTQAELDKLADEFIGHICASALIGGKATAAQIEDDKALVMAATGANKLSAARRLSARYEALPRGAALPKETQAPSGSPQTKGPSVRGANPAALNGATMTITQIAAYYDNDPATYQRLMAEHEAAQAGKDREMFPRVSIGARA